MRAGIRYDLRDEYRRRGYTEEETAEFDRLDTIKTIDQAG
jgi:D-alanine-D-alanine ligase